jgi:prepilin-type processing-associated H-X9-DG protein
MRQLLIATTAYQSEFKSFYPQPIEDNDIGNDQLEGQLVWFNALDPYLQQQGMAYADNNTTERNYKEFKQDPVWKGFPIGGNVQRDNRTIKMNENFGDKAAGSWKSYKDVDVRQPTQTVVYADGRAYDILPSDTINPKFFHVFEGIVGLRHGDGANVAFADGHGRHVRQAVRTDTAAPSWFNGVNGPQELTWKFQ